MTDKTVLDATCGSRMIWFEKEHEAAVFLDNRELDAVLCDGRALNIHPDVVADFRDMPFPDNSFALVVFDPPHIDNLHETSWMAKKYGVLSENWRDDIRTGYHECMRVLKDGGVLIFKWNEDRITLGEVIKAIGVTPLFGNRMRNRDTIWLVFMKGVSCR